MKYVYLLQSESNRRQKYIGVTGNIDQRILEHNSNKSPYTSHRGPWKLVAYIAFEDHAKADAFERYLKSGSGWSFAMKRFW